MASLTNKSYQFAFILITSLFFLWGFAHNLDPILIPRLRHSFSLTLTESTLVDSAVFAAYFFMAIPAGMIMKKFGYKMGIITGLMIFAIGCFLFVPAANTQQYYFFLFALFIIACGLTILETAANPYATLLGDPETATQRLNLSQSFNGLATALAPTIGYQIISGKSLTDDELSKMSQTAKKIALAAEASSVKIPYIVLGCILITIAVIFFFTKLPETKNEGGHKVSANIFMAFKHTNLAWGVVSQFFYVGAQVCILSLFLPYATKSAGITEKTASHFATICGTSFLIGRFVGTALMRYVAANILLTIYACINVLLCVFAIFGDGMSTVYCVVGICFFMSIMFPTIFSLGIKDLGKDTENGSSLIIMSIVGGAILPRFFGIIGDTTENIQNGYFVPLVCFLVIAFFGLKGHEIKQKDITLENNH